MRTCASLCCKLMPPALTPVWTFSPAGRTCASLCCKVVPPALTPVWTYRPRAAARTCASWCCMFEPVPAPSAPALTLVFTCMIRSPVDGRMPAGPRSRDRRRLAWLRSRARWPWDRVGITNAGRNPSPERGKKNPPLGENASFLALTESPLGHGLRTVPLCPTAGLLGCKGDLRSSSQGASRRWSVAFLTPGYLLPLRSSLHMVTALPRSLKETSV